mmetsp:Transcript_20600/g.42748  ORF Transcript_20600/g.42748 Transcript_20600/m.42748 type:complete len:382 (-) Transcript_20600:133-1278(-)
MSEPATRQPPLPPAKQARECKRATTLYLQRDLLATDILGLMAQLHGACLHRLAAATGQDLQGLHQGAAALKHGGTPLPGPLLKRLMNVETAYQVTRHLHEVKACAFVAELDEALGKLSGASDCRPSPASSPVSQGGPAISGKASSTSTACTLGATAPPPTTASASCSTTASPTTSASQRPSATTRRSVGSVTSRPKRRTCAVQTAPQQPARSAGAATAERQAANCIAAPDAAHEKGPPERRARRVLKQTLSDASTALPEDEPTHAEVCEAVSSLPHEVRGDVLPLPLEPVSHQLLPEVAVHCAVARMALKAAGYNEAECGDDYILNAYGAKSAEKCYLAGLENDLITAEGTLNSTGSPADLIANDIGLRMLAVFLQVPTGG